MASSWGRIRKSLFGLSPEEATFARRGFQGREAAAQKRLEQIGCTFIEGYHAALEEEEPEALALRLNAMESELGGFAFEGAAMGLALLDRLTPWKRDRWRSFVAGPGAAHVYMVHVGAGWALARLRRGFKLLPSWLDPLLGWLAVDGYGFHEGYFNGRRFVEEQTLPTRLTGYALRAFDQGLGRSLWFVQGADVSRIPAALTAFPGSRQADLWSGIGLACTYAGGVDRPALKVLQAAAEKHRPSLAQGAAFAAQARQRADNGTPHTEMACQVLCGRGAEEAARITDAARENLSFEGPEPAYEVWRGRIQTQFAQV